MSWTGQGDDHQYLSWQEFGKCPFLGGATNQHLKQTTYSKCRFPSCQ